MFISVARNYTVYSETCTKFQDFLLIDIDFNFRPRRFVRVRFKAAKIMQTDRCELEPRATVCND